MTVGELKKTLEDMDNSLEVVIPIEGFSIGYMPCTFIDGAYKGFDWDAGRFLICPVDPLKKV